MAEQLFNRIRHLNNVRLRYDKIIDDPLLKQVETIVHSKLELLKQVYNFSPVKVAITGLPLALNLESCNFGYLDEENLRLESGFDLIISNMSLHFVNDIESVLEHYKSILNPGGVFIAVFFGENNLQEVKMRLIELESQFSGGAAQRFIPLIQVKDAARVAARCAFLNVVSDVEEIAVKYKNLQSLMRHMKKLGQSVALHNNTEKYLGKGVVQELAQGEIIAKYNVVSILGFNAKSN